MTEYVNECYYSHGDVRVYETEHAQQNTTPNLACERPEKPTMRPPHFSTSVLHHLNCIWNAKDSLRWNQTAIWP
jgi:hypothetical protein